VSEPHGDIVSTQLVYSNITECSVGNRLNDTQKQSLCYYLPS